MKDIIDRFKNTINNDRLSHLYLLSNSTTTLKLQLVYQLAALIFQSENDKDLLIKLMEQGNHPNFIHLIKDGLSIKKDQIMTLQKEFSKTSLVSGPRVYVIEGADTMSHSAANSLLKFLEEPQNEKTIGFLLADDINSVLPTIISRAQVIRIKDSNHNALIDALNEEGVSLKDAKYISYFTNDLAEAKALLEDYNYRESVMFYEDLCNALVSKKSNFLEITHKIVLKFGVDKEIIGFILNLFAITLLDAMHIHMNQNIELDFKKDELIEIVNKFNLKSIQELIKLTHDLIKNLRLPINVNLNFASYAIMIEEIIKNGRS